MIDLQLGYNRLQNKGMELLFGTMLDSYPKLQELDVRNLVFYLGGNSISYGGLMLLYEREFGNLRILSLSYLWVYLG